MSTKPKPIKPFKTLDEEADFWDTHDVSDLGKVPLMSLPLLEPEKEEVLSIRVQRLVKEKLTILARSRGIGPTTLARMWILERLGRGAVS
ncbi:MAG: CopG family antitoxin [Patescibacteria group bacterium]